LRSWRNSAGGRWRTQQEQQETEAQARASSKDEGHSIAVFFESAVTIDDVAAAWMKLIAKKALPFDLVDDPIFRGAIELTAKASWKIIAGGVVQLPKRKKMSLLCLPPPCPLWWYLHCRCGVRALVCA
jgi:hypothetical protein